MRVLCVLDTRQLDAQPADLIVFPEGVCLKEIKEAELSHPNALIAAAIVENGSVRRMRGVLRHRGEEHIGYLKIGSDTRTVGTEDAGQNLPAYQFGVDMCVGVLICMDADHPRFSVATIDKIKASPSKVKVLCVPADTCSQQWVGFDPLPPNFHGVNVVLCNHKKTYQGDARRKSFITDTHGSKKKVQLQQ